MADHERHHSTIMEPVSIDCCFSHISLAGNSQLILTILYYNPVGKDSLRTFIFYHSHTCSLLLMSCNQVDFGIYIHLLSYTLTEP